MISNNRSWGGKKPILTDWKGITVHLCTAPTSTPFKTPIHPTTRRNWNKTNRLCSLKPLLCESPNALRYLSVSVCVEVARDANAACVYAAVRWDCSVYTVMCHTWLWIHVSFFLSRAVRMRERERVTGWHQRRFWRLMTAPRPLMTPSILSPVTHADYPQRHLLTLYANETERGE